MKTFDNLYSKMISFENLVLAWKRARMGKTKKSYVIEFEKKLSENLMSLHNELKFKTYKPRKLVTFVLRDPKTRVISKSDFRDRIVHHALCIVIEPFFEKGFIYDSCANRIGKGNLFALKRLEQFTSKTTNNYTQESFCLKADIKHYFQTVNPKILIEIIKKKISDKDTISLIEKILVNALDNEKKTGMPIGNLTSQFFANVYLNELDYFVKHDLRVKYYIRYVDDFVILHKSKEQLELWKNDIDSFLRKRLKLELHPQKSKIINLSNGVDFVGFRNFFHFKLPRKRNIRKMINRIESYNKNEITYSNLMIIFQGWQAYVKWSNSYNIRKNILRKIAKIKLEKIIKD
jgi:RNA-directed DNA polymerase